MPKAVLPRMKTVIVVVEPGAHPAGRAAGIGRAAGAFRVLRTTQVDQYDRPITVHPRDAASLGRALARVAGDSYSGTARRAAKISISKAKTEEFKTLAALIKSLKKDADMVKLKISTAKDSDRVADEQRNVRLDAAIYAASREADNDFHIIIGPATGSQRLFMNVEVSGLPPAGSKSRAKLEKVRTTYKKFFSNHPAGLPGEGYDFYDPPVPITIGGSLFFDQSHAKGGKPGPEDLRKDIPRIWEIHPITELTFKGA